MIPFTPDIGPLLAVAAATVDDAGRLVWSNAGFQRLIAPETSCVPGEPVAQCFLQPTFAVLSATAAGPGGEVHRGLMTIGNFAGRTQTLRGVVIRDGATLHVLGEHDIAELARLNETVLALNSDYAAAQLQLVQANLALHQLNTALTEQKAELQATLNRVKRLEGFLSICMYCKKIRAANDDWQQIEQYVTEHTDATLSHGMCPDCFAEQRTLFLSRMGKAP